MSQTRTDFNMESFLLEGSALTQEDGVIVQNGARATPLVFGTLMAKIAASGKWTPWVNIAAVDGAAYPAGVYVGTDILAATIVAGDVANCMIMAKGDPIAKFDVNQLVIENSLALTTVIGAGTIYAKSAAQALLELGFKFDDKVSVDAYENT